MIDIDDIRKAFLSARSNKRRSADSVEYELHAERNIARLYDDIVNHSLESAAYTFVTMKPRPREVFACDMGMRIVYHYIDMRMRPLIEARLTERTFNNRVGYGQDVAINTLITDIYDVSRGFTKDAWIISLDLSGYFPNANQQVAYEQMSSVVVEDYEGDDKDELLYMIQRAIFSCPTEHCYRKSPMLMWDKYIEPQKSLFRKDDGVGAAIGHLIWQNGMNYYLNGLDHWILENVTPHYLRFVDDMYFVVENKEAFLSYTIPEIRERLARVGCTLHPKKFYCQHYTKGVNALGNTIKMDRVYPSKRIVARAKQAIVNYNRCARPDKLVSFMQSVNSYFGIFKRRNAYGIIRDLVDMINPAWWQYCTYNDRRRTIEAKPAYKHFNLIVNKYNLKTNNYGKSK